MSTNTTTNSIGMSGSTVRDSIEKERLLNTLATNLNKDHPNMKLFKQKLEEDFIIPAGYNALAIGLEIPDNVNLTIPAGSTLVSL